MNPPPSRTAQRRRKLSDVIVRPHPDLAGASLIELTRGKWTIVDDADLPVAMPRIWSYFPPGYAVAREPHPKAPGKWRNVLLHRVLLAAPDGTEVDHINGDGLDNRRVNLRLCNRSENGRNLRKWAAPTTSRFKGVCWDKRQGRWRARIKLDGRLRSLGYHKDEISAASAYDASALRFHGEFARTNKSLGLL